ncbi:thioredoxin-domain-containing protein [Melanomma pulvis-pyrius CBS 109.77]|uniref:Thioredoxin-domain-containing protein n=1 Tax=Melanomma pulvis-pyrius CBS 109.77 TaxID=1314802 RepID=A0A6A6WQZ8_9PLEO|nr:thioredoxin-domain-containing protein [Melanomma pulvis-pyrius CBS 109.77]
MPAPTEISAPLHFRTLLTSHTYLVADFYATWCPPCKQIAPIYNNLSNTHSSPSAFAFVKINVDEQPEISAQYGIQSLPTFLLFKDGKVVQEIKGAFPAVLKKAVEAAAVDAKAALEAKEVKKNVPEENKEEKVEVEEKTVSGSYGMTGGNNWKMALN